MGASPDHVEDTMTPTPNQRTLRTRGTRPADAALATYTRAYRAESARLVRILPEPTPTHTTPAPETAK